MTPEETELETKDLAFRIANYCEDKKAIDTEVLDIRGVSDISDFIVICSGDSPAQLKAIARNVEESMTDFQHVEPVLKEGQYGDKWYLLDYSDVIVHIIEHNAREFYNLEELWQNALFIPRNEWAEI
ncbi:MAG: ribosome silencing factor [Candidatus Caenarcaniphilales bacterium]|nr:ribosome silencing factor [Candidatus Caenarcaniphilales bacterium]